jgi:hypothetical protein
MIVTTLEIFMKKHVFALLALTIAGSAMAQTPPAAVAPNIVSNISGVATEIDRSGNVLRSLRNGDVIGQGSTVSTTGSMTISSGGCSANLTGGASMLMSATSVCDASRLAQTGSGTGGAGTGTGVAGGAGGGIGGGGVFGASGFFGGLTPLTIGLGAAGLGTLVVARNAAAGTPAPISNN